MFFELRISNYELRVLKFVIRNSQLNSHCLSFLRCLKVETAFFAEFVCFPRDDRHHLKILCRRRRTRPPLQPRQHPRIVTGFFAEDQRMSEIDHRHYEADTQNRSPCGREYIQHLKLLGIGRVTTW